MVQGKHLYSKWEEQEVEGIGRKTRPKHSKTNTKFCSYMSSTQVVLWWDVRSKGPGQTPIYDFSFSRPPGLFFGLFPIFASGFACQMTLETFYFSLCLLLLFLIVVLAKSTQECASAWVFSCLKYPLPDSLVHCL